MDRPSGGEYTAMKPPVRENPLADHLRSGTIPALFFLTVSIAHDNSTRLQGYFPKRRPSL
jgi:hypothetical protein